MRAEGPASGPRKEVPSAAAVLLSQPERIRPGYPSGDATWLFKQGLLASGVETLHRCPEIEGLVIVAPDGLEDEAAAAGRRSWKFLGVVTAEPTAWGSVRQAVHLLPPEFDLVVVHDAARPLASPALFARVVQALDGADAVVPQVPVSDTVKRVAQGRVRETIPRQSLAIVQTPQGFRRRALEAGPGEEPAPGTWTDPLTFVTALGLRVVAIPGEPGNLAVRGPDDRRLLDRLLAARLAGPHGR
jgi:2-C-methyl-D-erythritol 4-phosphate cytidylyltransferase